VLRIFGPKRNEVKGEWRKLRTKELHRPSISSSLSESDTEDGKGGRCGMRGENKKYI